ncbi:TIGR03757 family integrating conjugative element protein [Aromatoleum bremense]|uniref:TIGR03757 family integrating conjugative element protein n=1 Tax=Aromatoleum bremense TaxID=76115 RepID=A0ABX1NWI1_9RHOO|nr:TIGR03757 family integrating conjugative element protein [Aromatoleum bremense]NMG16253.1 TIGR03757 family integrating conjugative element protein [Aromatoleum bremense]QTQ30102.1 Integrating conjugative element membrane protein, PFL4709 [Aromatoleum bremense]
MKRADIIATRALPLLAMLAAGPGHAQEHVEVFQLSTQQVRGAHGATVHYVDGIERVTKALSAGLPASPQQAAALARERFAALSGADRQGIEAGARALDLATRYRLTKVPAIVFDQRAVVYGVPDVEAARTTYRAWRARGY